MVLVLLSGALVMVGIVGMFAAQRSAAADHAVPRLPQAQGWVTTPDRSRFAAALGTGAISRGARAGGVTITIDPSRRYQRVIGFGAALTASSAELLSKLPPAERTAALDELFRPSRGAGINVLRVVVGASDFAATPYTYDDLRAGATDPRLAHFSIAHDTATILPLLRQARKINPHLVIIASPWSAPAWMKASRSLDGGTLARADYAIYARYLVRFARAYAAAGVPINAITAQNEPQTVSGDYPTTTLTTDQEATLIGDYLGPDLDRAGLSNIKILGYDDNWSDPRFPIRLLHSPARRYLSGTAFHCYAGTPEAQTTVHDAAPTKGVWMTECSGGAWSPDFASNLDWDTGNLLIGSLRNWAQTVMFWNLMLSRNGGPHNGGCSDCRGVLTAGPHDTLARNVEFAELAAASSAVKPGAIRIGSPASAGGIQTVAFTNRDGSHAMILHNQNDALRHANISDGTGRMISAPVPGHSTVSLRWSDHTTRQ